MSILLTITQEETKIEKLRRENANLRAEKKKINKNKAKKARDKKFRSDLRAADALKAKQKSTGPSSNSCAIVNQFGPKLMDISTKPTGTKPNSLTKDGVKNNSNSPAKRT